jgi:hypothetical protein
VLQAAAAEAEEVNHASRIFLRQVQDRVPLNDTYNVLIGEALKALAPAPPMSVSTDSIAALPSVSQLALDTAPVQRPLPPTKPPARRTPVTLPVAIPLPLPLQQPHAGTSTIVASIQHFYNQHMRVIFWLLMCCPIIDVVLSLINNDTTLRVSNVFAFFSSLIVMACWGILAFGPNDVENEFTGEDSEPLSVQNPKIFETSKLQHMIDYHIFVQAPNLSLSPLTMGIAISIFSLLIFVANASLLGCFPTNTALDTMGLLDCIAQLLISVCIFGSILIVRTYPARIRVRRFFPPLDNTTERGNAFYMFWTCITLTCLCRALTEFDGLDKWGLDHSYCTGNAFALIAPVAFNFACVARAGWLMVGIIVGALTVSRWHTATNATCFGRFLLNTSSLLGLDAVVEPRGPPEFLHAKWLDQWEDGFHSSMEHSTSSQASRPASFGWRTIADILHPFTSSVVPVVIVVLVIAAVIAANLDTTDYTAATLLHIFIGCQVTTLLGGSSTIILWLAHWWPQWRDVPKNFHPLPITKSYVCGVLLLGSWIIVALSNVDIALDTTNMFEWRVSCALAVFASAVQLLLVLLDFAWDGHLFKIQTTPALVSNSNGLLRRYQFQEMSWWEHCLCMWNIIYLSVLIGVDCSWLVLDTFPAELLTYSKIFSETPWMVFFSMGIRILFFMHHAVAIRRIYLGWKYNLVVVAMSHKGLLVTTVENGATDDAELFEDLVVC